jgi:glycerophosphoryl diester phosphodiesterase
MREEWLEKFIKSQNHGFFFNSIFKIINLFGINAFTALIESPNFVTHLRKRGIFVAFWTANTVDDLKRVKRANASGYVTDFPSHKLHLKADEEEK